MRKNKNKIFGGVLIATLLLVFTLGFSGSRYIISDAAVTTANDTLISDWQWIGTASNVSIFYGADDTTYVKGYIEYRYGTGQLEGITLGTADTLSIDTRSTAAAGISKGKNLRGYGLTTDLIPGANYIRVRLHRLAGSETTSTVRVALSYQD